MRPRPKTVLIGIQARSTSTRLPNKHVELIDGKRIIDHVLDACRSCCNYMNRFAYKNGFIVDLALLTPYNDPLVDYYSDTVKIVQGPENDVLARYKMAAEIAQADYIVRITGDCPLIPPYVISKHIVVAHKNTYDYVSNVDERFRTTLDGIDCEVMSRKLLDWLYDKASIAQDREHVTTLARRSKPAWAKYGFVTSYFDFSKMKFSIDTPEDLKRVREEYESLKKKFRQAEQIFGKEFIHRF